MGSRSHPGSVQPSQDLLRGRRRFGKGSESPGWRFAKLRSTMRGHSHPTLSEELEEGGEARPASHTVEAAAAITGSTYITLKVHRKPAERRRREHPTDTKRTQRRARALKKKNTHTHTTAVRRSHPDLLIHIWINTKRHLGGSGQQRWEDPVSLPQTQ